ncbi:alanine--tRNA ligase, partial [candidate division KSB1 bacterium]|nr:alanine--tRNA ligase [candidate division KSB1 bacterium]
MHSREVRNSFLDFFGKKGHKILHSAPVIPQQDPTLLFTNAGMNQFKDIFIGAGKREYNRAVNSQKCIRVSGKHNDLEEVGVDTYHHTFFEMLGNWSFGDYYKREAIQWAWELFTEVWKLDADKLYATVYLEDDESEKLWYEMTNIEQGRVYKFGKSENFWEMGETGPCGPCSEIHYDLGAEYSCGSKCSFGCECGRYQELWNLVFIQFNRENDGKLTELPAKHVDTGMGFERITAILQGKRSNYDTDLFERLIESISEITGLSYTEENDVGVAFRVICDHIRALTFALADGAAPSNEGRGYVLRRILRRAARYSRDLNIHDPFMFRLVKPLIETMGADYPEIVEREEYIRNVIQSEE